MKTDKSKRVILIAVLIFLLLGGMIFAAVRIFSGNREDVTRGLAGKNGQTEEEDSGTQAASYAEPVEVYEGHLDTVVLIYMVGSNLESKNGLGTMDLHEICEAYKKEGKSDQPVKFIVQTGGCKKWQPDFNIPADKSARYEIDGEELVLKQEFKLANMTKPGTLADFISWGMASYPADRYGLILWDHGGGSVLGFGSDEKHSGSMMRLQNLKKAFEAADGHFAFIGFDACLMGTVETAYMLKPFADYLIASEEMEPGDGWFYTDWVGILLKDPKASVETFGKKIVDDFAESNEKSGDLYTLSLIDLGKIDSVYEKLVSFIGQSEKALEADKYVTLSKARYDARSFGNGGYEQIDIIDYAEKSGVEGSDALKGSVSEALVHFRTNMKNANGLAMYYPYDHLDKYTKMNQLLETLNFDQSYRDYFSGFCTVLAQSDDETKSGGGYSKEDWYRADMERSYEEEAEPELPENLPYKQLDGLNVVDISQEQVDKMTSTCVDVWLDTGNGYLELGQDTGSEAFYYDSSSDDPELLQYWTDDTDASCIAAYYDKIWITLEDTFVPFYMEEFGYKETADGKEVVYDYGYVPAFLTRKGEGGIFGLFAPDSIHDEYVWLRVELVSDPLDIEDLSEKATGSARVCGYWVYDEMELEGGNSVRNLQQLKEGDKLGFSSLFCEYGKSAAEAEPIDWAETVKVPKEGLRVGYAMMEDNSFNICLELRDAYQNEYYTDWVYVK